MERYFKEPFNSVSHLAAAVAAAIGLGFLLAVAPEGGARRSALLVYGISMVLLFTASGIYHALRVDANTERWLRKLDHSAVYLLIAGTFTPPAAVLLDGAWRWGLLAPVWLLALTGIGVKLLLAVGPRRLSTALYLLLGWIGVVPAVRLYADLPQAVGWLLAGGLFYTFGAVVYARKRPDPWPGVVGFHGLWHLFVIGGSLCHYLLMLLYVAPYPA